MNQNFTDIVSWATNTPSLGKSGSYTTMTGKLLCTELADFYGNIQLQGAGAFVGWEGASADDYETVLYATGPTADRAIYLPDAAGTIALTSDITGTVWDDQSNIIANSVFN
jgi:hypothetical protein